MPDASRHDASRHVVVAGVATRALAASARRAGYAVTAIDAFGDLDLRAVAATVIVLREETGTSYSAPSAARAARGIPAGLAAYTANFENAPDAVDELTRGRILLGNPPAVLRRVRRPVELMRVLRRNGFAVPETRATPAAPARHGRWLLKPRHSGGGHGTRVWDRRGRVPRGAYLQERIAGVPGSVVFAADGRRSVPLALTRQLVGDPAFGARGFRYCGSLLSSRGAPLFDKHDRLAETAASLAGTVTEEFALVGLNGLDFVARDGVPYPIEVNPRWSASMELVERAHGVSMFEVHARAAAGELPAASPYLAPGPVEGKAVVFAPHALRAGDTRRWPGGPYGDVPHPSERIEARRPVCTVFARGDDGDACYAALVRRAGAVLRATRPIARGAA